MYEKVLVPLDGSELAESVLPHLEALVKGCVVKDVIFIHVVWRTDLPPEELEPLKEIPARYLEQLVNRLEWARERARSEVLVGRVVETIGDYAAKHGIDLIVLATHGQSGLSHWVWGSTAERVMRSTCVPVFMVRPAGYSLLY